MLQAEENLVESSDEDNFGLQRPGQQQNETKIMFSAISCRSEKEIISVIEKASNQMSEISEGRSLTFSFRDLYTASFCLEVE